MHLKEPTYAKKSSNSKTSSFIYLEMHQSQHEIKMDPIYVMLVSGLTVNDSSVICPLFSKIKKVSS